MMLENDEELEEAVSYGSHKREKKEFLFQVSKITVALPT